MHSANGKIAACAPGGTERLFEPFISGWIFESVGDHEADNAGETPRCDVEATSTLAVQAAPTAHPAEALLDMR